MRILVDENMPMQVMPLLRAAGHEATHINEAGLQGVQNGAMLRRAVDDGYDALLTGDTKMPGQQNLAAHDIAIVVVRGPKTPRTLPALLPQILAVLASAPRRAATEVPL